jgi:hypothetical protein
MIIDIMKQGCSPVRGQISFLFACYFTTTPQLTDSTYIVSLCLCYALNS